MSTSSARVGSVIFAGLLGLSLGCSSSDSNGVRPPGDPAVVSIVPDPATVTVGSVIQLQAVVKDARGQKLTGAPIVWTSSNASIASVSAAGLVTGAAVGTTHVSAAADTASDSVTVNVTTPPNPGQLQIKMSSYLGGSNLDQIRDVAVDSHGNLVLAGNTISPNFPTTPGSYDPTFNTGGTYPADAIVAKVSSTGALLWSTLVGGPNYERAYGLEVDAQDNIIIAGRAGAGLPVTPGVFQPTFGGGPVEPTYGSQDGFICKLDATGSTLIFCTYLGVADHGFIRDVAVDQDGDIYVAECTSVGGFPAAWFVNAFQKSVAGGFDWVVVKIASDGTKVRWATYLGGPGDESCATSIRVDGQKNVYLYAPTPSSNLTVTPGGRAYSANNDFYLAKIDSSGHSLLYGTYIGGSGREGIETHTLAITPQGEVYASGYTASADFPTTAGAYQAAPGQNPNTSGDMFIVHVSSTGVLLHSTYYGGSGGEMGEGITVDGSGDVYVSGFTNSPLGEIPHTLTFGPNGLSDMLLVKFDPQLGQRLFSARIGGPASEFGRSVVVSPAGDIYVGGTAKDDNWPLLNSLQPQFGGGGEDGALVRIGP